MNNVKVKQLTAVDSDVESKINDFLAKNNIELIDIKFQTAVTDRRAFNTALIIYKEGEIE